MYVVATFPSVYERLLIGGGFPPPATDQPPSDGLHSTPPHLIVDASHSSIFLKLVCV
jgi:hypothetical protein